MLPYWNTSFYVKGVGISRVNPKLRALGPTPWDVGVADLLRHAPPHVDGLPTYHAGFDPLLVKPAIASRDKKKYSDLPH